MLPPLEKSILLLAQIAIQDVGFMLSEVHRANITLSGSKSGGYLRI
jgi:hypothetical protein